MSPRPETTPGPDRFGRPRIGLGRVVRRTALILTAPLLAVACSLPVDERVTRLEDDEIPPEIGETTTTTTTTTTLPPTTTTLPPTTTIDGQVPPSSTTTTMPTLATEPVNIFYTLRFTTQIVRLQLELPAPVQIAFLVDRLETPTDVETVANLRTSVRSGLIVDERIVVERGTVTIPLDPDVLRRMNDAALERAIAQIVLTFTSFRTPDQGNIGSVVFEVDGEGFPVFVPAGGGSSEPGEPLAFSDFAQLILSTPSPTTTTTRPPPPPPPATTTTTVAATTIPPDGTTPTTTTSTTTTSSTTTTTVAEDQ